MGHSEDENKKLPVMDLVDHAVVARADLPFACAPDKAGGSWGPRLFGQKFDHRLESSSGLRVELAELARCCRRKSD
jgi:hypothetical protein